VLAAVAFPREEDELAKKKNGSSMKFLWTRKRKNFKTNEINRNTT
jgi:hypothetical protein